MLQQSNRWAEAAEAYALCLSLSADGPWRNDAQRQQVLSTVGTNYGLSLQKLGKNHEALASYDRALSLQPTNADNHHNRGNALYATSRHPEAVAAFTTALTLQPTDTESYFNLGNAFDKMGHARDAAGAFTTVLRLAPNDAAAAYNLANALKVDGKLDQALFWYRGSLKADPTDVSKVINFGNALDSAARFVEAENAFNLALNLAPSDAAVYTSLAHTAKSQGTPESLERAVHAYEHALRILPSSAAAYSGLAYALKEVDPQRAAQAFAAFAATEAEGSGGIATEAKRFATWLETATPPETCAASARDWPAIKASAVYPEAFERSPGVQPCHRVPYELAVEMGFVKLLERGPLVLTNATLGWRLHELTDEALVEAVGNAPFRMLVMPKDVHPILPPDHPGSIVDPAASGIHFRDYLKLLDRLALTEEFAVYVAQLNLLRLPSLLRQVCLPKALPGAKLSMTNLWLGGRSMKNGLHFDNFDNLLHQLRGTKRALLLPPDDTPHLYYASGGTSVRLMTSDDL